VTRKFLPARHHRPGQFTEIINVSVPAGSYLVLAKLSFLNDGAADSAVSCEFPGETDESPARVPPPAGGNAGPAEIVLQHAETLATAGTISVECVANPDGDVVTAFDKLTAMRIGALPRE
jgi:hypothetical protein